MYFVLIFGPNLCFIEASLNFLLYHMQTTFLAYLYPKKNVAKFLSGPKKTTYRKFFRAIAKSPAKMYMRFIRTLYKEVFAMTILLL